MSLGMVLLIVLILLLIGVIPAWPHSRGWGYAPSGILGLVVVVLLILMLMGLILLADSFLVSGKQSPNRDGRLAPPIAGGRSGTVGPGGRGYLSSLFEKTK